MHMNNVSTALFYFLTLLLCLSVVLISGCSPTVKKQLSVEDIASIQAHVNRNVQHIPEITSRYANNKLSVLAEIKVSNTDGLDKNKVEQSLIEGITSVLLEQPFDFSLSLIANIESEVQSCGKNNVLPVRLTITHDNRIFSYGAEVSEQFLADKFSDFPKGCKTARITFLYEDAASLSYIHQINELLDESSDDSLRTPVLLKMPNQVYL